MLKTRRFDIAELLKTEAQIQALLKDAQKTGHTEDFLHALRIAARAQSHIDFSTQKSSF